MEVSRHVEILREEGKLLVGAAREADLDAAVPDCPHWKVRDLVQHIGGVHRWAAGFVASGMRRPTNEEEAAAFFVKVPDGELVDWYCVAHSALVSTLDEADPSLECWTFLPAPSALAFWARRQAHETAIHRVDMQRVSGEATSLAPEAAADGIDELLCGFVARRRGGLVSDPPVTLGVSATDTGDGWTVRIESDRRLVNRGDAVGDCVLSGRAESLYLMLWNRREPADSPVEVRGDDSLLGLWREKAGI